MWKPTAIVCRRRFSAVVSLVALMGAVLTAGCAAMSNPGLRGVPVHLLPPALHGKSVEGTCSIPLALLGQERPAAYRIDAGDVLGVWIEGILGERGMPPPIMQQPVRLDNVDLPPSTGFPIQVQTDGTISLPQLEPLSVRGLTFKEAENLIRKTYSDKQILKADRARIIVSLMRPRTFHVLVLRQDSPMAQQQSVITSTLGGGGPEYIGVSRKGSGWDLTLPAYQNDVLTALAKTGGLPGTDAVDVVIVERNTRGQRSWDAVAEEFKAHGKPAPIPGGAIVQIPLRTHHDTPLTFGAEDVVLHDGDVVFIPAREERLFYTGGLLPPGQHLLPRDKDLDVLEAVARVRGPMFNGAFSTSNLSGTVLLPGLGQPSPTCLSVVRRLPDGCGQVTIRVDLAKAVKDARERILVQPGDFLVLQETPSQGMVRYVTQMADIPFYYFFNIGPNLFTGAAFSVPGGTAPATITPMNTNSSLNKSYTNTGAAQTPFPITTGR